MYIHDDVAFRPIAREDLEPLRALHNEQSTLLQFKSVEMPSELEQVRWWESISTSKTQKRFAIVKHPSGELLGTIRLQHIDLLNSNCEVGLDIMPDERRKGWGRKSYEMLIEYLFMHMNMHMIYVRVTEFNPGGQSLYKGLGFIETGRLPEHIYRHGKYTDHVIMSMTRGQYLAAHPD